MWQFQIYLSEDYILESDAAELLHDQARSSLDDDRAYFGQKQAQVHLADNAQDAARAADRDRGKQQESDITYEEMILDGQRYLCGIPRVDTEDSNSASQEEEASKADEQTELARATDRGLELLHEMEDKCLYYVSGWWSYSFCYQKQVKQFHALPSGRGAPTYPPIEDPTTHSFVLGKFPRGDGDDGDGDNKKTVTDLAELQTKGGTRYLVQRLAGGTTCDLTGRERKVEVQFHCHPQSTDRIGWIKELTTCSYLMVIYTPRLCNDVAFLPPQQDEVHSIECREVIAPGDVSEWKGNLEGYRHSQTLGGSAPSKLPVIVGGIEVGARILVGKEGREIEKGRVASAGEERVDIVAKRENGEIQRLSKEELEKYDLDSDRIEQLKQRLEEMAKGKDWTLEIVESNGERGLRGILNTDDEDDTGIQEDSETRPEQTGTAAAKEAERPPEEKAPKETGKADSWQEEQRAPFEEDAGGGSEETFKDEL